MDGFDIAAAAAFGAASVAARRGVPVWDVRGFRVLNALPGWLAPVVWGPMQAGALAAPLTLAGVLALRGSRNQAVRMAVTGVTTWAAAKVVKRGVARGRPADHVGEATLRLGAADNGLGYPSGHAAVAVTVVRWLTRDASNGRKAAGAALATVVGLSRIYVGAHFPLDVIGGWSLGALTSRISTITDPR